MKKYLKVFLSLISLSSKRYMEYRVNTYSHLIGAVIFLFVTIFFMSVLFSFSKSINGWTYNEVLVILGTSKIVLSLFYGLLHRGISFIPTYIKNGDLDFLIIKPINPQFYISFRMSRPYDLLINTLAGLAVFIYGLLKLDTSINFLNTGMFVLGLVCGFIILYSIYYSIATLGFWMGNFSSLNNIYSLMTSPMSLPTSIYGKSVSFAITYILMIGLVVTVPVQIFLHGIYHLLIIEICLAILVFIFSCWFWKFSLKHYTSASS